MPPMEPYIVYWQPGCTSCLRAKEFLSRRGIAYQSVNVRAAPEAQVRLSELGARSIPVITRGAEWVYGQDIDELAAFVGATDDRPRLPLATLHFRLLNLLAAAERFTAQLPDASLEILLPGRADRAAIDLAFHVPMIVRGFLDAARGGCLTFEYFERRPAEQARTRGAVIDVQRQAAAELASWRAGELASWRAGGGNSPRKHRPTCTRTTGIRPCQASWSERRGMSRSTCGNWNPWCRWRDSSPMARCERNNWRACLCQKACGTGKSALRDGTGATHQCWHGIAGSRCRGRTAGLIVGDLLWRRASAADIARCRRGAGSMKNSLVPRIIVADPRESTLPASTMSG
jgi:glutaredoxin